MGSFTSVGPYLREAETRNILLYNLRREANATKGDLMSQTSNYAFYSNPVEGRDDEYNNWYDKVHLPELLAMFPQIKSAKRYSAPDDSASVHRYLTIYEIEGDLNTTVEAIDIAAAAGKLQLSDAIDVEGSKRELWLGR